MLIETQQKRKKLTDVAKQRAAAAGTPSPANAQIGRAVAELGPSNTRSAMQGSRGGEGKQGGVAGARAVGRGAAEGGVLDREAADSWGVGSFSGLTEQDRRLIREGEKRLGGAQLSATPSAILGSRGVPGAAAGIGGALGGIGRALGGIGGALGDIGAGAISAITGAAGAAGKALGTGDKKRAKGKAGKALTAPYGKLRDRPLNIDIDAPFGPDIFGNRERMIFSPVKYRAEKQAEA